MSLQEAKEALLANEPDLAHQLAVDELNKNPDDIAALFIIGTIYSRAERYGLAHTVFKRVVDIAPRRHEAWNNLGMCLEAMERYKDARDCFNKALQLDKKSANYHANIALTYLEDADRQSAVKWATKALELAEHSGARSTLGFAQLGLGDWANGWDNYRHTLGGKFRKAVSYGDEPLWDGSKDKRIVVYGEQGLGDEIMYASCLPDAIRDSKQVVIDCDSRLEGLFKRSFPQAEVHGTRRANEIEWEAKADANCPIGMLPYFYRKNPQDCPATPYLKADPERVLQWKALFNSYGKPVIGICWSGGSKHNHQKRRHMGLDAFRPLFDAVDAVYVSLQYKPESVDGYPVKVFERATLSPDYDDTAGLVAALDGVVGIHTAAHHLAGALGVPATVMVPAKSSWAYAMDSLPWYQSKMLKQKAGEEWKSVVQRMVNDSNFCWVR